MKLFPLILGTTLALATSFPVWTDQPSLAVQLADGTVYFSKVPQLVGASATFKGAYSWGSTYTFVITIPEEAGEPLQRVTIAQNERVDDIRYYLNETRATEQEADGAKRALSLQDVTLDRQTQTLTVAFDPPVQPGRTVTIELSPITNPSSGVYLFGVTAFPRGEKVHGQFLGYGRIHIYDRGYSSFGFPGFFFP